MIIDRRIFISGFIRSIRVNLMSSTKKPELEINYKEIIRRAGIQDVKIGKHVSERSLVGILHEAAVNNETVRLLRLAGPKGFRKEIIRGVYPPALIDKRIKKLEFILTNPYSEPFLTRMDAEQKDNCSIWRVRGR